MNLPWTHCGLPALSLFSGKDKDGLPFGIQLVGKWHGDEAVRVTQRIGEIENIDLTQVIVDLQAAEMQKIAGPTPEIIWQTDLDGSLGLSDEQATSVFRIAQEAIEGSCSILLMTDDCIYAARDRLGHPRHTTVAGTLWPAGIGRVRGSHGRGGHHRPGHGVREDRHHQEHRPGGH